MHLKILLGFSLIALAGCQSAPSRTVAPKAPAQLTPVPSLDLQEKSLRQQQQIQALIAQNDALHSRVRELEAPRPEPMPEPLPPPVAILEPVLSLPASPAAATRPREPEPAPAVAATAPPVTPPPGEPAILPNADGVIDLVALLTPVREGDEVNPFAVRTLPADAVREVALHVQGVIHGTSPCALINRRAVLPGETAESLTVTGVEMDAVLIRHAGLLLRLPVAEKAVRIRLPL